MRVSFFFTHVFCLNRFVFSLVNVDSCSRFKLNLLESCVAVNSISSNHDNSRSLNRLNSASSFSAYSNTSSQIPPGVTGALTFTMAELMKVTGNFSPSHKIGQGGFGTVYKGKLKDGTVVAVKRAKKVHSTSILLLLTDLTCQVGTEILYNVRDLKFVFTLTRFLPRFQQDAFETRLSIEFQNELDMLSQVDHLNLVKLIGYLEEEHERILVVEYVPNGNLREHLDGMMFI